VNRLNRIFITSVCVLGAILVGACAEEATGPQAELLETPSTLRAPLGFSHCSPQPFASGSARIGPKGGIIRAGKHSLRIPAGALKSTVLITMEAPSASLNYVVFSPEGLTFDPANLPTLVMSYGNCDVKERAGEPAVEIVYTNDALTAVLETTEAVAADTQSRTFGALLKHFSTYALKSRYALAY
jgi:hypothetical protein